MTRGAFVLQVKVTDVQGRPVQGATIAALPLPTGWAKGAPFAWPRQRNMGWPAR